jgi:hypothetical protein
LQGYAVMITLSAVIAATWAWPKQAVTRRLPLSDTRLSVVVGDVLKQKGNIIVGVTDVFDTELGEVIHPKSLQGQFQSQVFPNTPALDASIQEALAGCTAYWHRCRQTKREE